MKKIILPIIALTLVAFGIGTSGITEEERDMALTELERTQDYLLNTLEGLTESQLKYKPSPESWSIAECVEHLSISEQMLGGMLTEALKTPADPSKRDAVTLSDEDLLIMISSRENKVKTGKAFEPSGKFGSHDETVKAFLQKRGEHIEYLKTTKDDLRNHYGQLPFATIDGLQILLFISGHTERHILQMEEVMAHENYPMQ
ncbi:DinB family protein [Maribacter polysiphoniae]|uniref:DinB family protein n=1 Tax=Maribacter polysiphoniae TaxID=429344 RepID=A0A316E7W7_9FLAO|nr:DinB family protein [Maribacter polysiphoniae]MBD1260286.1 DinB family protein [Maribacter polysiphoniae]PWK25748.1 DinB family protein [Maribacter polysiphoniae]